MCITASIVIFEEKLQMHMQQHSGCNMAISYESSSINENGVSYVQIWPGFLNERSNVVIEQLFLFK